MAAQQLWQKILMDRHAAFAQHGDFLLVVIDAHDRMADLSKAHGRHETHIARAHHGYRHWLRCHFQDPSGFMYIGSEYTAMNLQLRLLEKPLSVLRIRAPAATS